MFLPAGEVRRMALINTETKIHINYIGINATKLYGARTKFKRDVGSIKRSRKNSLMRLQLSCDLKGR